jgi:hypothetical protein
LEPIGRRAHLEFAAVVGDEGAVVEPRDGDAVEPAEPVGELLGVRLVAHLDGDLAQRLGRGDGDGDDVADEPAVLGDAPGDRGELAGAVGMRRR